MKTIYRLFILVLCVAFGMSAFAQQRTVKFTGRDRTNQYRVKLDRVEIFNLDQLWEEVIYWPDTTLMMGTVGLEDFDYQTNVQLMRNVPNPFDGRTEFALFLPEGRDVRLELFDMTGKFVTGENFPSLSAGTHLFEATLASPQTYLLSATVKDGRMTLKMINEGHGGANAIRYMGMTDLDGDFTVQLKNDRATGLYPFTVGDEMQYTGYTTIDGTERKSNTVNQKQFNNETVHLLFDVTVPTVITNSVANVSSNSATVSCQVTNEGDAHVTSRGVCWSTSQNPTINNNHTTNGSGMGSFNVSLTGLKPNTTYYVRAYATNGVGTSYGVQRSFKTGCNAVTVVISGNANINYGQSTTLTASGASSYHWNTNATTASITVSPTSTTTYMVTGTNSYGCTATASKTVTVNPVAPTVSTNNVTNISTNSATCGGNVTSNGGANVSARGVCWGTSQNPTVSGSHTTNGSGTGSFTSSLTGLIPNTTYYIRTYATNSAGTGYGAQKTFTTNCNTVNLSITGTTTIDYGQSTTLTASGASSYHWSTNATTASITVSPTSTTTYTVTGTNSYGCTATASKTVTVNSLAPMVTTNNVTEITTTTATCGGNVTATGGASVTARGVCWSTSQNPTVINSHTNNGSGTGSFTSSLTGLTPNTTYYVRAYATNSAGTGYGVQKTFTTLTSNTVIDEKSCPAAPTVTDHEGNVYATVQIGNQCWMRDNLRTTTSPSTGTYLIPAANANLTFTGKQARWYNNDSATYAPMNCGLLYNWNAAVDTFNTAYGETSVSNSVCDAVFVTFNGYRRGICPAGWHLPSDAEWTQLTNYVSSQSEYTCGGNSTYIAKALASKTGWNSYSGECSLGDQSLAANNATGFSAVPAGEYFGPNFGESTTFWSSTQVEFDYTCEAWIRHLNYYTIVVAKGGVETWSCRSVRCLRDEAGAAVIDEKSCPAAPTVTDHEGNVYATVQIGSQCWMRDNLRTTTSPSTGTYLIPAAGTSNTYTGKQARWYNNDSTTYAPMNYGLLYNWNAAVDTFNTAYGETSVNTSSSNVVSVTFNGHRRGICPAGWHLPCDAEWTQLENYVSSQSEYTCNGSGNIAKALASTEGWNSYSGECYPGDQSVTANNATGFSAVPAGLCRGSSFLNAGNGANFWSATQHASGPGHAYYRHLDYYTAYVDWLNNDKYRGYSVRCLRDAGLAVVDEKSCPVAPTVTDHEGNVYATVQIGNQCWMRDNLRTTTSPSTGTYLIPDTIANYTFTGKQARWYNNDSATYAPMNYGLLYNWNAAVDTFNTAYGETSVNIDLNNSVSVTFDGQRRGICPAGWHLPRVAEWEALTNYVGSVSEYQCDGSSRRIAKVLASTTGWNTSTNNCAVGNDQSANNATGFSAVPAGVHTGNGYGYSSAGTFFSFLLFTESIIGWTGGRGLSYDASGEVIHGCPKSTGNPVRCVKD